MVHKKQFDLNPISLNGPRTQIMGILNVTPDSFYDGGHYRSVTKAVQHALKMQKNGADIIDIGGESTRPGADPITIEEESERVIPVIEALRNQSDVPISIDTYKAEVAAAAIEAGANMINDISAMTFDPAMSKVISDSGASVILMHIKGTPKNMQKNPEYREVITEIYSFLAERKNVAISAGIERNRIVLDPGIGFGKSFKHNFTILNRLREFRKLECPILIGLSRKSFLSLDQKLAPNERLITTAAANAAAILNGADILRVHDVSETDQVRRIIDSIKNISD